MSKAKVGIAALVLSAMGLVGLVGDEGWAPVATIPTKGDVPTVGFGTTGGVKLGDKIDPVSALKRAMKDVNGYEGALKRCVFVPMSQEEYDTYVQFSYNIGSSAFCSSTVVKELNAKHYVSACNHILDWKMAAGYDCSTPGNTRCYGLWTRRVAARNACMEAQ